MTDLGPPRLDSSKLPHTLYRMFDKSERLLYLGITKAFDARMYEHRRYQPWFELVDRIEREEFPDFKSARQAELVALLAESPIFNVMHASRIVRRNTGLRAVAIPDGPWCSALIVAHDHCEEIHEVVTRLLSEYVAAHPLTG
jgi:hypothetical protein